MKKKLAFLSSSFIALIFFASVSSVSAAQTLFGEASIINSGGNPGYALQTVSDADPGFGGASFNDANGTTFSSLATLSTDYNVTDDDCGAGSPRFSIRIDNNSNGTYEPFPGGDGNVLVYIGPSPSFTNCLTGWQATGNLMGNNDAGRYDTSQVGGSPSTTYASALALIGSKNILNISLVIDSGWNVEAANGVDGEQTVLFDNVTINSAAYSFSPQPTGQITSPAVNGDHVSGVYNFTATYNDGDAINDDAVQWAIRQGPCSTATTTVFGNVDGRSDPYNWNGSAFSSALNTATLTPGQYCFVFNPTDDPGETNIRELRDFVVDPTNPQNTPAECSTMSFDNVIQGTEGSDDLRGTPQRDIIFGRGGSDRITGLGQDDCLIGGPGSDSIDAGAGNDVILAGDGSDQVTAGAGNDKAWGGADSDNLLGEGGDDQLNGQGGMDNTNGGAGTDQCVGENRIACEGTAA